MEKTFVLRNLACPNCAAKIEDRIKQMTGMEEADFSLGTQQLRVKGDFADAASLQGDIQKICDAIEEGVVVQPYVRAPKKAAGHDHGHGHDHDHEHSHNDLTSIIIGAIVLIGVSTTQVISGEWEKGLLFIVYIALAWSILWISVKNLFRGNIFDENFLMSVATIGALAIGDFAEAVGVILFYRVGTYFEERATNNSRKAIMDAVDMRPEVVRQVSCGGQIIEVDAETIQVGDLVEVRVGDRVPLDGTIVEGETRLDTAPVTGEPVPVAAGVGTSIVSGCVNETGRIVIRVDKPLSESMVTRILDAVENAAASKPQINRFITRFARIYTPVVVALAVFIAIVPSIVTGDWNKWIYTALTFLVISCPCALVLSVPLAFFAGIGRGSKLGILFKGGISLEVLRHVKAVALDKTGTITTGEFSLQQVETANAFTNHEVVRYAASLEAVSSHPIAQSIVAAAKEEALVLSAAEDVQEIAGAGLVGTIDGKRVAVGNRRLMEEQGVAMAGMPTVTYGSEVFVAIDNIYAGALVISDALKSDSKAGLAALKSMGLKTVMLTGDRWDSAEHMAQEAGVDEVRAELLPTDKLTEVQALRKEYGSVMFVGDGINDAPVLAGADVGGAMGSGADAAIEAADVVYMRPSIAAVAESFRISKQTLAIAWQNIVFAIAIKVIIMAMGIFGYANIWLAVFADTGVSILCILNSMRLLLKRKQA